MSRSFRDRWFYGRLEANEMATVKSIFRSLRHDLEDTSAGPINAQMVEGAAKNISSLRDEEGKRLMFYGLSKACYSGALNDLDFACGELAKPPISVSGDIIVREAIPEENKGVMAEKLIENRSEIDKIFSKYFGQCLFSKGFNEYAQKRVNQARDYSRTRAKKQVAQYIENNFEAMDNMLSGKDGSAHDLILNIASKGYEVISALEEYGPMVFAQDETNTYQGRLDKFAVYAAGRLEQRYGEELMEQEAKKLKSFLEAPLKIVSR